MSTRRGRLLGVTWRIGALSILAGLVAIPSVGGPASGAPTAPTGALTSVTAIALAENAGWACALSGGSVWCWGENENGQLGDGATAMSTAAVQVKGVSGATAIALGYDHACALVAEGRVICWGNNSDGELGGGSDDDEIHIATVVGVRGATSIAAGEGWTCATVPGKLLCWGSGYPNEDADRFDFSGLVLPTEASSVTTNKPAAVKPGVPTDKGTLGFPLSFGVPLTKIYAGTSELCGTAATLVFCLGDEISDSVDEEIDDEVVGRRTIGTVELAVADSHACARLLTGRVRCWGSNDDGQLGDGTTDERVRPVDVVGVTGAKSIAAEFGRTCAVSNGGKVSCWGEDLGLKPQPQAGFPAASAIATDTGSLCVLASGEVWCAGDNEYGQLGNGTTKASTKPVRVLKR